MKSVNYALRSAYVTSLNGLTVNGAAVPVYYLTAPQSETAKCYITLNGLANSDISTKSSADTSTSIQVQIHTWSDTHNAGAFADVCANEVLDRIYPYTQAVLDLSADGFQMVSTTLTGDTVLDLSGLGNREYITRILTFTHNVVHI